MKKLLAISLTIISLVFVSCNNAPSSISLSPSVLSMVVGDMAILEATNMGTATVNWYSENDSIATVFNGVVSAVGVGHTNIIATSDGATGVCVVSVTGKDGATLSISPRYVELEKTETCQFTATSSYDIPLTWASSNEEVATVDENGKVTAHKPGHADITVTNGMETCKAVFAVKHHWGEYSLVWEDNFNGSSLNTDVWNIEVNGSGGGNGEKQYYTDRSENLRVEDGNLVIQLRKEDYNGKSYTSGRINSKGKKAFKYGKIESRIMFPSGGGTWPAFWMMGNDYNKVGWPRCGEIDIIEHIGNQPRMLSFALHTPAKNGMSGNNWSSRSYFDNVEGQYHTYGIEWLEEENYGCDVIKFTYDGEVCATVQESLDDQDVNSIWPFNKEHFIIFNLAIGGSMGGTINDNIFNDGAQILMKVDWVRVYQRQEK